VGRVAFIVGELLIIESQGGAFVVDLENWLCDEERNLVGFVMDVFGKIERPYYALRPEVVTDISTFAGKNIFYIEGTSKILRDEDIKSMKSKSALEAEEEPDDDSSDE
jgi:rRNA processing protein Gar1